jgi:pimeloyl-ACP methyl ester carboxylesterase
LAHRTVPLQLRLLRLAFRTLGELLPGIMGSLACRLWFRAQRHPEPGREMRWRQRADQSRIDSAGTALAIYSWGEADKPTVLLVHGWSGRGTQLGGYIQPLLDAGYRVAAFDAPAHGRTPGTSTHIFQFADALTRVASHFAPIRALIAHSFGVTASALALRSGLQVGCLVGIAPPADATVMLERFGRFLGIPEATLENLRRRIDRRFPGFDWRRLSARNMLTDLGIPALIIHDRDDADVPCADGQAVAQAANAELLITQGLGHRRILRDKEVITRTINFIDRHVSGGHA